MNPESSKISRLFIEISERVDPNIWMTSMVACHLHKVPFMPNFFDTVIYHAGLKFNEVWNAIKLHDEIYCSTSLAPHFGVTGGQLFNNLMRQAIQEGIEHKKIYILREFNNIDWEELKAELVNKSFRANTLYATDARIKNWVEVDIDKLINERLLKKPIK